MQHIKDEIDHHNKLASMHEGNFEHYANKAEHMITKEHPQKPYQQKDFDRVSEKAKKHQVMAQAHRKHARKIAKEHGLEDHHHESISAHKKLSKKTHAIAPIFYKHDSLKKAVSTAKMILNSKEKQQ